MLESRLRSRIYGVSQSDEINAAQTRQAQQRFLGRDFLSHVTAQQGATCSRCHQTTRATVATTWCAPASTPVV